MRTLTMALTLCLCGRALAATCDEEAQAAADYLRLVTDTMQLDRPPGISLVRWSGKGGKQVFGPMITIDQDQAMLDGRRVTTDATPPATSQLFDELVVLKNSYRLLHPGDPFPGTLLFMIDAGAPWSRLVEVSKVASRAGYPNLALVFEDSAQPARVAGRYAAEVAAIQRERNPSLRATMAAALLKKAVAACPAMMSSLSSPDAFRDALRACRCAVALEDVRSALSCVSTGFSTRTRVVVLADQGTRIAQSASTPWAKAHEPLVAAGVDRVTLMVR